MVSSLSVVQFGLRIPPMRYERARMAGRRFALYGLQMEANFWNRGWGSWMVWSPTKKSAMYLEESWMRGRRCVVPVRLGGESVRR